jgi:hypothetical protein
MNDRKEKFRSFLAENPDLPIYIQDWYLDVVCGKEKWNTAIVEKAGKVIAVLPYCVKRNRFFKWIGMPPLSKMHGPYIVERYNNAKHHHSIIHDLLSQLPKIDFYQQGTSYDFRNWLPYLWEGFSQVTLYSYVLDDLRPDVLLNNMDPDCRRRIKIAETTLAAKTDLSFPLLYELLTKTFKRQNLSNPFTYKFLEQYFLELDAHSSCALLGVADKQQNVQSMALLIWDKTSSYYLLEANDPNGDKNAPMYLKWLAIKYTHEVLKLNKFDFEGSISKRIEKIYREFGAKAMPYFVIKKHHSKIFLGIKFLQNYRQYGKLVQW